MSNVLHAHSYNMKKFLFLSSSLSAWMYLFLAINVLRECTRNIYIEFSHRFICTRNRKCNKNTFSCHIRRTRRKKNTRFIGMITSRDFKYCDSAFISILSMKSFYNISSIAAPWTHRWNHLINPYDFYDEKSNKMKWHFVIAV